MGVTQWLLKKLRLPRPRGKTVSTDAMPGTREFFSAKDKKMAEVADYGLMVWDKKSAGTLNNIFNLLHNNRASVVFLHKERRFVTVKTAQDIASLVATMSEGAKNQAERKIGLSKRIRSLSDHQHELPL